MTSNPALIWVLRIAVLLQCVGLFRIIHLDGTAIGTTMFMSWGWSEATMLLVERGAGWALILAGLTTLVRPMRPALVFVSGWFLLVAFATWYQAGSFGAPYAVPAHATRFILPLALAAVVWPASEAGRRRAAELALRVAAAATFTAHGIEALRHHPLFIDYVITAFSRVGIAISEAQTRHILVAIGVQDLFLAALILARRWRAVAAYMAFWGAITAGSRIVHMGFAKWPAVAVRAANVAVPLALFMLWRDDSPSPTSNDGEPDE